MMTPSQNLGYKLKRQYDEWNRIKDEGQARSNRTDGMILNELRANIRRTKERIEETLPSSEFPVAYYKPDPPEMPGIYMAQPELIRAGANATYFMCLKDPWYLYLKEEVCRIPEQDARCTGALAVLAAVRRLEEDIRSDNLVGMRERMDPNSILWYLCASGHLVQELKPPENTQLTLFHRYDPEQGTGESLEPILFGDEPELMWGSL